MTMHRTPLVEVAKLFSTSSIRSTASEDGVFRPFQSRNAAISRPFFNIAGFNDKKKEFSERKLVGYSMEQMYSVVADVERYNQFLPFCKISTVLSRSPGHLKADLVIGFPPVVESYTSSVRLVKPHLVQAICTEGNLFNYLETLWRFSPGLRSNPQSCIIDFSVSFEFRSLFHSQMAHLFFEKVVKQMEHSFVAEARRRYGHASIASHALGPS